MQSSVTTPQSNSEILTDPRWAIIQTMGQTMSQATTAHQIQTELLKLLTEALDYQAAQIYQLDTSGQVVPWPGLSISDTPRPVNHHLVQQAIQQNQLTLHQHENGHSNGQSEETLAAEIALPLMYAQTTIGALWVQHQLNRQFTPDDYQFLQTTATLLAANLTLVSQTQSRKPSQSSFDTYISESGNALHGYQYTPEEGFDSYHTPQQSPPLAQWGIATEPEGAAYQTESDAPGLVLPIRIQGQTVGLLGVDSLTDDSEWSADDRRLLEEVSEQAAQALENAQLLKQAQERTQETEQLYEIGRQLVEADTVDDVYELILETIRDHDVDRVSISLLDKTATGEIETVWIAATWDKDPEKRSEVGTRFSAKDFDLVQTFANPPFHPLISEDLSTPHQTDNRLDEPFRQFVYEQLGMQTMFSAPMFLGNDYKGVLSIYTRQPHQYGQREVRLYQMLADQAIIVIENHTLLESTRQERDRAAQLSEFGQKLNRATTLEEVQQATLDYLPTCGFDTSELYLTDGYNQINMASNIPSRQALPPNEKFLLAEQLLASNVGQMTGLTIRTAQDSDWVSIQTLLPQDYQQMAWMPIASSRSQLSGALACFRPELSPFSQNELTTFESIAQQLTGTLENVWLLEETAQALKQTELLYKTSRDFNAAQSSIDLLTTLVAYLQLDGPLDFLALSQFTRIEPYRSGRLLSPLHMDVTWQSDDEQSPFKQPDVMLVGERHAILTQLTPSHTVYLEADEIAKLDEQTWQQAFAQRQSLLAVPLMVGQNWLGVLWLGSRNKGCEFPPETVQRLTALTGQVAVVMQNLALVASTQYNLYRTELLSQLGEGLLAADTTEAIYQASVQATASTLPNRGVFIFSFVDHDSDGPNAPMKLVAALDAAPQKSNPNSRWESNNQAETATVEWPTLQLGTTFQANDLGLGRLVWRGHPVVIESINDSEQLSSTPKETLRLMQISGLVAVPIWLRKQVSGFVLVAGYDFEQPETESTDHAHQQTEAFAEMFAEARVQLYQDIARRTSDALEYQRVFDEANYRARLLQTTAEISETATASLDLAALLPQTVDLIRDRLGFYHASIFLVDEYQKYAIIQASTGSVGQKMLALRHKLAVGGKSIVGTATGTGKAYLVLDIGQDSVHFNNPLLSETRSEMALPLIARGKVIGALDVQSRDAEAFTESDIAILQSMANQLANAIEAAQAFQDAQEALEETNKLHDFYLREEWRGFLREEHKGRLSLSYEYGNWLTDLDRVDRIVSQTIDQVLNQGETLIVDKDMDHQTSAERELVSAATDTGEKKAPASNVIPHLITPLRLHDQATIGTLDLEIPDDDETWDDDNLQIIEAVATQAAQAIETARLFEQSQSAREEAEALYRVVRTLVTINDEQLMFNTVMEALLSALGIGQGGIMMLERGSVETVGNAEPPTDVVNALTQETTASGSAYISRSVTLFLNNTPVEREALPSRNYQRLFEKLVETKAPIIIEAAQTDALLEPLHTRLTEYDVRSMLVVPIIMEGRVYGAARADTVGYNYQFSEREVTLARVMVDQLAITLQNYRLLDETNRRAVQLQTSADVSRVATSILDQEVMLTQAVDLIQERFGFYHVQVFIVDSLSQYAVLRYATGDIGQRLLDLDHKVPIGSMTVIGDVSESGQSVVVRDIKVRDDGEKTSQKELEKWGVTDFSQTDEHHPAESDTTSDKSTRRERTTSSYKLSGAHRHEFLPATQAELAVPLQVGDTTLGVLDVQSTSPDAFSPEEISTLESLASQLAIAIQNARQFKEQQETAARLREVDKLKTQFLANMSHELRTPLNSIIGFSRVILKGIDGPLTELQKADLTSIHNSGQHLLGLINNMLDLSKIEAGKMELNFEEMEIEPMVKQVMSTAIALVKDKPVKLITKVDEDIPVAYADSTRIRQVTLNLVSNACKFTEEGEIVVRASANKDKVTVSVTDSGIGIPQEKLGSVFEEFTQVDASTTRKVGGTGLGLPISRHFIEMHKGQIWVESELGVGSTFSFAIPINPPEESDQPEEAEDVEGEEPSDETASRSKIEPGKKIILAVDPDPNVIALYQRFLTKQYEVIGINDSDNIIAKVKHYAPSAILLDVLLPGMDGWSVLADLKENSVTQAIPIIICSTIKDKNRAFNLGVADYLVKPIVENELVRALRNVESIEREKTRVLIVDDHVDDVLLIRRMLEAKENFKVIEANDGREGLKIVESMQPDLIICDLNMPEMNGFRVVEALKNNDKTHHIPIIIVSAQELSAAENKYLNNHVELLLKKGIFTEKELLEDIGQILETVRKH